MNIMNMNIEITDLNPFLARESLNTWHFKNI